jgi:hypothetical protein
MSSSHTTLQKLEYIILWSRKSEVAIKNDFDYSMYQTMKSKIINHDIQPTERQLKTINNVFYKWKVDKWVIKEKPRIPNCSSCDGSGWFTYDERCYCCKDGVIFGEDEN